MFEDTPTWVIALLVVVSILCLSSCIYGVVTLVKKRQTNKAKKPGKTPAKVSKEGADKEGEDVNKDSSTSKKTTIPEEGSPNSLPILPTLTPIVSTMPTLTPILPTPDFQQPTLQPLPTPIPTPTPTPTPSPTPSPTMTLVQPTVQSDIPPTNILGTIIPDSLIQSDPRSNQTTLSRIQNLGRGLQSTSNPDGGMTHDNVASCTSNQRKVVTTVTTSFEGAWPDNNDTWAVYNKHKDAWNENAAKPNPHKSKVERKLIKGSSKTGKPIKIKVINTM